MAKLLRSHITSPRFVVSISFLWILALIVLSAFIANTGGRSVATAADNCRNFSQTGYQVCGRFLDYWNANGGLAQQGYPISGVFEETNAPPPAGDGKVHQVQYFQRARFEEHTENQPPYDVLLGLLGAEQVKAKYPAIAAPPKQPGTCQYFKETDLEVCGRFLEYWLANGGLAQQGYPITGVFNEQNAPPPAGDGKLHRVQYFQRARFEEHSENQKPYDVLLGLLGAEQYQVKYASNPPTFEPTPPPTGPTTGPITGAVTCLPSAPAGANVVQVCVDKPTPAAKSNVTVFGRLIINGQPVSGAQMMTVWHYKSTTPGCSGTSDSYGIASCGRDIGSATSGYRVEIDITFNYNGKSYTGSTSFTPQ